jgi:hypothetical protein
MPLLVKTFRIYLVETVKRFFPRNLSESDWDSGAATFRRGNSVMSTIEFCDYAEVLMAQYWKIILLTPELTEFRNVMHVASEAVRLERQHKQDEYHRKREEEEKNATLEYGAIYVDHAAEYSQIETQPQKTTVSGTAPHSYVKQYATHTYSGNPWTKKPNAPIESPVSVDATVVVSETVSMKPQKRIIKSGGNKDKGLKKQH